MVGTSETDQWKEYETREDRQNRVVRIGWGIGQLPLMYCKRDVTGAICFRTGCWKNVETCVSLVPGAGLTEFHCTLSVGAYGYLLFLWP